MWIGHGVEERGEARGERLVRSERRDAVEVYEFMPVYLAEYP